MLTAFDRFEETTMYFEEITLGATVEIAPAPIPKDKMIAFAKDYDNIPLHTDEEYAKNSPFGKLIAPGVDRKSVV